MSPPAAVAIPTRDRPAYLLVALASVLPQAADHGAEVVVVDDGRGAGTSRTAARLGVRCVPAPAPGGLNVARNAAVAATSAPLVCFLDDDVEAAPGWLAALLEAAARCGAHEAFGGPIRGRLEGARRLGCGREGPPLTHLELGAEDRDAERLWGANLAVRRSALERVGPFDPRRSGPGDEEEWERRLRAAGGRLRYVADAEVAHRRAGPDARLGALARAAWHRGRAAQEWDADQGSAPRAGAEATLVAACLAHAARRRCPAGLISAAEAAGRWRTAVHPAGAPSR